MKTAQKVLPLDPSLSWIHGEVHARPATPIENETAELWHWILKDKSTTPLWESVSIEPYHTNTQQPDGLLRWERHTEFVSGTFVGRSKPTNLTLSKLEGLSGHLWTAVRVRVFPHDTPRDKTGFVSITNTRRYGSLCTPYKFEVLSDLLQREDGTVVYEVFGDFKDADARGRFVRRIVEMETYRFVALLGLREIRSRFSSLDEIELKFSKLLNVIDEQDPSVSSQLVAQLTSVSLEVIKLQDQMRYRIGATKAYFEIVKKRLESLEETRFSQRETFTSFLAQRFEPAIKTVFAFEKRLQELETSVRTALSLSRTIIDRDIQQQNQIILKSTETKATEQVALTRTVERFTVIALTYYFVSLIIYAMKPLEGAYINLLVAVSIPLVAAGLYLSMRYKPKDKSS